MEGIQKEGKRLRRDGPGAAEERDGDDHISDLHDDLLLDILGRLGCTGEAAKTTLLSRRWSGLWTRLPEVTLYNVTPDKLDAALARIAAAGRRDLSLLDIHVDRDHHRPLRGSRISSLLRSASRLAPARFLFKVEPRGAANVVVELPCFHRATMILLSNIDFALAPLPPPPAGSFSALETLFLFSCHVDPGALVARCPALRTLWVEGWGFDAITVHSPSLEALGVRVRGHLERVDVAAPALKTVRFVAFVDDDFTVTFSAPLAEDLSWCSVCQRRNVGIGQEWGLVYLCLKRTPASPGHGQLAGDGEDAPPEHVPRVHTLDMRIHFDDYSEVADRSIEQEMAQLPFTNYSVLQVIIKTRGHVFGGLMCHLLGIRTIIRKLKVAIAPNWDEEGCLANCPCDQPDDWRSQTISLTCLEGVELRGFKGEAHEVDFLKLLLRSATQLKRITVEMCYEFSPSDNAYMEINDILKAHPSTGYNIYYNPSWLYWFA